METPDNYNPSKDVRGMMVLELKDLSILQKAFKDKYLISTPLDSPAFDPTLAELIKLWALKFDFCLYLGARIPNTTLVTYYVVTINVVNPGKEDEFLMARSMMYGMRAMQITKEQLRELLSTFLRCEKSGETIDDSISSTELELEEDEADHPAFIDTLEQMEKFI